MERSVLFILVKWGLYAICLFALIYISTSALDSGHSVCLIKNTLGTDCPGCGMTRALSSVMHGDFTGAFHYNRLVVIVFPLLAYIGLKTFIKDFRYVASKKNRRDP